MGDPPLCACGLLAVGRCVDCDLWLCGQHGSIASGSFRCSAHKRRQDRIQQKARLTDDLEQQGWDPAAVSDWLAQGWSMQEIRRWSDRSIGPDAAASWTENDVEPSVADRLIKAGWSPDDVGGSRQGAASVEEALRWAAVGLNATSAAHWEEFSPREAKGWLEVGVDVVAALSWATESLRPQTAIQWSAVGIGPTDARRWLDARVRPAAASEWLQAGIEFDAARRWLEAGFTAEAAGSWIANGFDESAARDWVGIGVPDARAAAAAAVRGCFICRTRSDPGQYELVDDGSAEITVGCQSCRAACGSCGALCWRDDLWSVSHPGTGHEILGLLVCGSCAREANEGDASFWDPILFGDGEEDEGDADGELWDAEFSSEGGGSGGWLS